MSAITEYLEAVDALEVLEIGGDEWKPEAKARGANPEIVAADQHATATQVAGETGVDQSGLFIYR